GALCACSDPDGTEDLRSRSDLRTVLDHRHAGEPRPATDHDARRDQHVGSDDGVPMYDDADATVAELRAGPDLRLGRDLSREEDARDPAHQPSGAAEPDAVESVCYLVEIG